MNVSERDSHILRHIIGYCDQINEAVHRFGDEEHLFLIDAIYQNAVALCLLQIGELGGHLSEKFKSVHQSVPWRPIKSLRNIIAHNYGSIDAETTWEIIKDDIPDLKRFCMDILEKEKD